MIIGFGTEPSEQTVKETVKRGSQFPTIENVCPTNRRCPRPAVASYPFNDPSNEKHQNIKLNVIRSLLTGEAREPFQRAYEEAIGEKKGDDRTTSSLNATAHHSYSRPLGDLQ